MWSTPPGQAITAAGWLPGHSCSCYAAVSVVDRCGVLLADKQQCGCFHKSVVLSRPATLIVTLTHQIPSHCSRLVQWPHVQVIIRWPQCRMLPCCAGDVPRPGSPSILLFVFHMLLPAASCCFLLLQRLMPARTIPAHPREPRPPAPTSRGE
jgi:hypothetical protein